MPDELRQKAIRLLARREHTRAELTRKLAAYGTPEEIATLLADMQAAPLVFRFWRRREAPRRSAWLRT